MDAARAERAADLHDKDCAFFLCNVVFAFFRRAVRIHILKLLRGHKEDLLGENTGGECVVLCNVALCMTNGAVDAVHHALQRFHIALLAVNDALPIPLVNEHGVEIIGILVATDGVHIGIKALAVLKAVVL